jgi:hypothetical protein
MPLRYPADWKFDGFPHEMPDEAHRELLGLIRLMAEGADRPKAVYEKFKSAYGSSNPSSDAGWAESDMQDAIRSARDNAARYIANFYGGMEAVEASGIAVPSVNKLNKILSEHDVPLVIDPPELKMREGDIELVDEDASEESLALGFVLGERIGFGGFGSVYRVTRKTKLGAYHYAMKVFDPSSFNLNKERASKRFIRELRLLETLQHRAIIPLLEAGLNAQGVPYILMPCVEGKDLRDAFEGANPVSVYPVFDEILNGLQFAHRKGVLHRDLKPKNILVRTVDQQPQILDFGAAFMLDDEDEGLTTTLVGTEAYVPDEVRRDPKNRSERQDIYASGMLLYEVIGRRLPDPNDYEPLEGKIEWVDGLDEVIKEAIAPERKRFQSVAAMREKLADVARRNGRNFEFSKQFH